LAIQGTPILTIKELMGHQTLAMTERYSHLSPDHKKQAIEGIENYFAAAETAAGNDVTEKQQEVNSDE
jgi:integrase